MKLRLGVLCVALMCLAITGSAFAGTIFDDGPTNGTVNGYYVDGPGGSFFQQTISDGFVATGSGSATSVDVGIWVPTGETLTNLTYWLGTSAFGSDISSGSTVNNATYLFTNGIGYDIYEVELSASGNFTAGNTYYLTLGNGQDSNGDSEVAWDVNGGPASCSFAQGGTQFGDCGGAPGAEGEAFTLNSGTPTPEPCSMLLLGAGLGLVGVWRRK